MSTPAEAAATQSAATQTTAAQSAAAQSAAAQEPAVAQQQPVAQQPVEQQSVEQQQPVQQAAEQTATADAFPSRRELRNSVDSAPEAATTSGASQPLTPSESYRVAAEQPVQPIQPPPLVQPTEPVTEHNLWNQPSAQSLAPIEQDLTRAAEAQQIPQEQIPQVPVQPNAWNQPAQTDIAQPWSQPAEQAAPVVEPVSGIEALFGTSSPTAAPEATQAPTPTATLPVANDSLFGAGLAGAVQPGTGLPAAAPTAAAPGDASQWGLTPSTRRPDARPRPQSSSTAWVWVIAISPLIAALTIGYVLANNAFDLSNWMLEAAAVVPYLLVILFAVADRSRLAALDHDSPITWAWAALTAPVYLIVRATAVRRETGGGGAPIIFWVVSLVVALLGFVAYGMVSGHPLTPGLPGVLP